MADFLELCQRVRQECGIAGAGPTSVLNQVGILAKVVDRTRRAWVDIQASRPYWKFQRNQLVYTLVPTQREYSVKDDFGLVTVDKWDRQSSFLYEVSAVDEQPLTWREYQDFRQMYRTFEPGRPQVLVETPLGKIAFERTPDKSYTLTMDYWMTPEALTANTDIPACPEHYHDVIVWKSVMMFSGNEIAPELLQWAKSQYDPMYIQLLVDQGDLPASTNAFPIAKGDTIVRNR